MIERYRGHLIFAKANLDRSSGVWTTSLHVQFNEDQRTFRDVWLPSPIGRFMGKWLPSSIGRFMGKRSAEKHALQEAKQWVDARLLKAKIFGR